MSKYSVRNIVLGIGIGLIAASIVNLNAGQRQLTKEDIIREAEKYNLIVIDDKAANKAKAEATPVPESTPTPIEQEPVEEIISISIKSGVTSDSVAEQLLDYGLISDKNMFIKRLEELQKSNRLQIGTFKIIKGSTVDEIIEILTTIPR